MIGDTHDANPCNEKHNQTVQDYFKNLAAVSTVNVFAETIYDQDKGTINRICDDMPSCTLSKTIQELSRDNNTVMYAADCRFKFVLDSNQKYHPGINSEKNMFQKIKDTLSILQYIDPYLTNWLVKFSDTLLLKQIQYFYPEFELDEIKTKIQNCDLCLLGNVLIKLLTTRNQIYVIYFGDGHCENIRLFFESIGILPDYYNNSNFRRYIHLKNNVSVEKADEFSDNNCCVHNNQYRHSIYRWPIYHGPVYHF